MLKVPIALMVSAVLLRSVTAAWSQQEISHRQGLSKVLPYNPARVCRALTNWSKRLSCKGAFAKAWFSGVIG
jgi:3-methyladenine DNA glycosylase Mpg